MDGSDQIMCYNAYAAVQNSAYCTVIYAAVTWLCKLEDPVTMQVVQH